MKPVIFLTVYRRYHELIKNIERVQESAKPLRERADIVLLWHNPEVGKLWIFQELLSKRKITHLITRIGEGQNISYEEGRNIRLGLEFIDSFYTDYFVIFQTADIWVQDGIFEFMQNKLYEGKQAVLFHMENGVHNQDIFHTNFWAVSNNRSFWPPVSGLDDHDILERIWGRKLREAGLNNFTLSTNFQGKRFLHRHESEHLSKLPDYSQRGFSGVNLYIEGYLPWYTRLKNWFRSFKWRKS